MFASLQGNSIKVQFGFSPDLVQAVKQAPDGRRWNKETKSWLLPATINNLRFVLSELRVDSPELRSKLNSIERPLVYGHLHYDTDWRCTPFAHQTKALDLVLNNPAVALFHEQGLGKTLVAIKAIEHRFAAGQINAALIVCPKTVITAWQSEFARYSDIKPILLTGSKAQRTKALNYRPSSPKGGQVYLVNYDLLATMRIDLAALLSKIHAGMLVLDESHFVKTHTSQRAKAAYELRKHFNFCLLLTGTPIARDPSDCFSQFRILDEQIFGTSFYAFRNHYFQNEGRYYPDWKVRPDLFDEIKRKLALRSQRLMKRDALDLPAKLYQLQTVEMEPEQRRIYREIERELMTEVQSWRFDKDGDRIHSLTKKIAVTFLPTRMIRLNQICSGYLPDGAGSVATFPHGKLSALREIVDGYDGKIVIWAHFTHDIEAIAAEFKGALVIQGSTPMENRQEAIERFQMDPAPRLIVLQTATGAQGITLTAAHLSVRYSRDYNLINQLQSEDRLHRINQKHAVTYIDLVCQDSIEQDIVAVLEEKRLMAGYLQGDIDITDAILARFMGRK